MEYFMLSASKDVVNPIELTGQSMKQYVTKMGHEEFRELEQLTVAYTEVDDTKEAPDVLADPTYLISDKLKLVLEMHEETLSFKAIQVFPQTPELAKDHSYLYWVCDAVMEDCIHESSVKLPNGAYQEIILDRKKVHGRHVFRPKGLLCNKLVVSLDVAESILRRIPYGVELIRLKEV